MVQILLDSELARGPLPAYTRIQEFISKVCIFPFVNFQVFFFLLVCLFFFIALVFSRNFHCRLGQVVSCVNTSSTIHKGLDLLFADIPKNLLVPNISTDVPTWNKLHESYYECLFAFAKSNLYDHGAFFFAHCASASVSKIVFYWAHTYDFYVAEDWFGMNDLDLQSHVVPSGVVSNSPSPTPLSYYLSFTSSESYEIVFIVVDSEIQHQGSCLY